MFSVIASGTCGYVIKTIDMITLMLMTHAPSVSKIGQVPFSFGQLLMVKKLQQLCTLKRWKVENVYWYAPSILEISYLICTQLKLTSTHDHYVV